VLDATRAAVSAGQTAACWIALDRNGDVFVDNAGNGTIASYQVSLSGQVTYLRNTSAGSGAGPLDDAVSSDGDAALIILGKATWRRARPSQARPRR
jgi:hypothetical protein